MPALGGLLVKSVSSRFTERLSQTLRWKTTEEDVSGLLTYTHTHLHEYKQGRTHIPTPHKRQRKHTENRQTAICPSTKLKMLHSMLGSLKDIHFKTYNLKYLGWWHEPVTPALVRWGCKIRSLRSTSATQVWGPAWTTRAKTTTTTKKLIATPCLGN